MATSNKRSSWQPVKSYDTWLQGVSNDSPFSLANIPLGIFSTQDDVSPRTGAAVGDWVLDFKAWASHDDFGRHFPELHGGKSVELFARDSLNSLATLGRPFHQSLRHFVQQVLTKDTAHPNLLRDNEALREKVLVKRSEVKMHLPMHIGDYTDFYAGLNHATNVGCMFRDPKNALQPNYLQLPVGYHGRSSSIVVSGTPIKRPRGQILTGDGKTPADDSTQSLYPGLEVSQSRALDFELEMGCFISQKNEMGDNIPVDMAEQFIFGYVLLNDWSARDIQKWEYVPLGPFNSKNFASSISPWVVLADALKPFRTQALKNKWQIQSYLQEKESANVFDIRHDVEMETSNQTVTQLTQTSSRNLVWSFPQMIAHHTLGGCPLRAGDLLGTGTISGDDKTQLGSLLEISQGGKADVMLSDQTTRRFLQDGDTVVMRGYGLHEGYGVGFGECRGTVTG